MQTNNRAKSKSCRALTDSTQAITCFRSHWDGARWFHSATLEPAAGGVFDRVRGGEAEPLRFATGLSLGASVPSRESGR